MQEMVGFWIGFTGWILLLSNVFMGDKLIQWVEKRLYIPWYITICTPVAGIMMALIGWGVWASGSQAHYPGYPLNTLCEWLQ